MRKKSGFLMLIALAVVAGGTASIVLARGHSGENSPDAASLPPDKQTAVALEEASRARDMALPYITTKSAPAEPFSTPSSCPGPTEVTGTITPFRFGPFPDGRNWINWASALGSTGDYYQIWAGAPADSLQKGLLRVWEVFADSCLSRAKGTLGPLQADYVTDRGPLTLTKIAGDTVSYSIAGGGTGSFNFVTGQFLK